MKATIVKNNGIGATPIIKVSVEGLRWFSFKRNLDTGLAMLVGHNYLVVYEGTGTIAVGYKNGGWETEAMFLKYEDDAIVSFSGEKQ